VGSNPPLWGDFPPLQRMHLMQFRLFLSNSGFLFTFYTLTSLANSPSDISGRSLEEILRGIMKWNFVDTLLLN